MIPPATFGLILIPELPTEYMKAIAVSVTIVEAIAMLTGGECAYELFFGTTKKSREHKPVNMDSLIHFCKEPSFSAERMAIYNTLKNGRDMRSRFDHKTSTLSAYLYGQFSEKDFNFLFEAVTYFHQGKIDAGQYLAAFDQKIIVEVISFLVHTALSRKESLINLKSKLSKHVSRAA